MPPADDLWSWFFWHLPFQGQPLTPRHLLQLGCEMTLITYWTGQVNGDRYSDELEYEMCCVCMHTRGQVTVREDKKLDIYMQ